WWSTSEWRSRSASPHASSSVASTSRSRPSDTLATHSSTRAGYGAEPFPWRPAASAAEAGSLRRVRIGLALPQYDYSVPGEWPLRFETVVEHAQLAERAGYDSLW